VGLRSAVALAGTAGDEGLSGLCVHVSSMHRVYTRCQVKGRNS
jgi:hypothetical protein